MRKDIVVHRIQCAKAGQAGIQEAVIPAFTSFDETVIAYEQAGSICA
jgi:hypothetical protein